MADDDAVSETEEIAHPERELEAKTVVQWDEEAGGWVVTHTAVTEHVFQTTTRYRSQTTLPTYADAARRAEACYGKPVYLRGDDRARAETEAAGTEA